MAMLNNYRGSDKDGEASAGSVGNPAIKRFPVDDALYVFIGPIWGPGVRQNGENLGMVYGSQGLPHFVLSEPIFATSGYRCKDYQD